MSYSVELTQVCSPDRLAPPSSPRRVGQGHQQDYQYISASHGHKVHCYSVTIIRKDSFLCSSPIQRSVLLDSSSNSIGHLLSIEVIADLISNT